MAPPKPVPWALRKASAAVHISRKRRSAFSASFKRLAASAPKTSAAIRWRSGQARDASTSTPTEQPCDSAITERLRVCDTLKSISANASSARLSFPQALGRNSRSLAATPVVSDKIARKAARVTVNATRSASLRSRAPRRCSSGLRVANSLSPNPRSLSMTQMRTDRSSMPAPQTANPTAFRVAKGSSKLVIEQSYAPDSPSGYPRLNSTLVGFYWQRACRRVTDGCNG